jgi:hypothetical protein
MDLAIDDPIEPLAVVTAAVVIASGIGIVLRRPWRFAPGGVTEPAGQLLGSLGLVAVGVVMVWLVLAYR